MLKKILINLMLFISGSCLLYAESPEKNRNEPKSYNQSHKNQSKNLNVRKTSPHSNNNSTLDYTNLYPTQPDTQSAKMGNLYAILEALSFGDPDLNITYPQDSNPYNVNIVGFISDSVSLSRHASAFIDCLQHHMPLTLIKTRKGGLQDIPEYLRNIVNHGIDLTNTKTHEYFKNNDLKLTGITVFTDGLTISWQEYLDLPNHSSVKIMFTVTERTEVPEIFVTKMNQNFDALVVPDPWMIDVLKNSGVTLPIFVLPLVLDHNLQSLLTLPLKQTSNKPFTFGMTGGFTPRKNHSLILKAFAEEFGNNPNFKLRLHGAYGKGVARLLSMQQEYHLSNVEIIQKRFSRQEYEDFIRSLDCYSFVSKGEGFSITPREAMAAGVPCIISNNTAHKVICKTGFVCSVPSNIIEPAYYVPMEKYIGNDFNCDINDVKKAMREVYNNYKNYLALAPKAREWVTQYLTENLTLYYLNLIKPRLVILGPDNLITNEYLMTNSEKLYKKYQELCYATNTVFKNSLKK